MFSPGNVESLRFVNSVTTSSKSSTAKELQASNVILWSTGPGKYCDYFIWLYIILTVGIMSALKRGAIIQLDSDGSNLSNLS